jgi:hypothetical protein
VQRAIVYSCQSVSLCVLKDTGQTHSAHRPQATVHQAKAREKASSRDPDRANDHIAPNTPRFRRSAHLSKTASTSTAQDTSPQRDGTRVGISLLRAPNNCSPLPPSAINESVSTSKKRLRISSPSRRHEMMLRGIQLWGRRHQETPHLSDQLSKNTAVSRRQSLGLGVSVKAQQTSLPASNGHICKARFRAPYKSANKPAMSCCGIRA